MYRNATVEVFVPTITPDGQGLPVKDWGGYASPAAVFSCDVQPVRLSPYQKEAWGISDLESNAKHLIADFSLKVFWSLLKSGNRARVNGMDVYDIRGEKPYSRTYEAFLSPVQGE